MSSSRLENEVKIRVRKYSKHHYTALSQATRVASIDMANNILKTKLRSKFILHMSANSVVYKDIDEVIKSIRKSIGLEHSIITETLHQ
jgi:macrodomain Ter protein organizer (MatP/YcbG family)